MYVGKLFYIESLRSPFYIYVFVILGADSFDLVTSPGFQLPASQSTQSHTHTCHICTATVCVCSLFNDIRVSLFITSRMLLAFDNILYLSISIVEKATQYKPSHPLSSPYLPFSHCTLLLCTKTVV